MSEKFNKTEVSHQEKKECEFDMPEGEILKYLKKNQESSKLNSKKERK